MQETQMEMPKYQCHKKVWAFKIKEFRMPDTLKGHSPASTIIVPEEEGYAPFTVDNAWIAKHNPSVGGYYVVYEDGYKSYSPEDVFEAGYTKI